MGFDLFYILTGILTSTLFLASPSLAANTGNIPTCFGHAIVAQSDLPTNLASAPAEQLKNLTRDDVTFLNIFEPEKYAELVKMHPEYEVWVEDELFKDLEKIFEEEKVYAAASDLRGVQKCRDRIEVGVTRLFPKDYWVGHNKFNAFLSRVRWRAKANGRAIPGDPGAPRFSKVDEAHGGPHLPPIDGSGVVAHFASGEAAYTVVTEPAAHEANAYDPQGMRIGSVPGSMSDAGQTLDVGHMYINPENQNRTDQRVGSALISELLKAHPQVKKVSAGLYEMNGHAFMVEYDRTHDYYAAIRATPLYKQIARSGFTVILPPPPNWLGSAFVPFEVERRSEVFP